MSHIAIICAVTAGLLLVCAGVCRAAAPSSPTVPGIDWPTVIALGLAALAGVRVIVDALLAFFKAEAPLTQTLVDDHIRDSLQTAHDKLDQLAGSVNALVELAKPVGGVPVITPATTPAPGPVLVKGSGTAGMLAILLLGALAAPALTGCSSPKVQAIEHALWDCTAPERADAVAAVTPAVVSVIKAAGSADGKAIDLSTVKAAISKAGVLSEAGVLLSCAMANAIAILVAPAPTPAPGAPAAAPYVLDPVAIRAVWDVVKRDQLGGADFKVAGGAVL